jgi:hypothetical protein
MQLINMIQDGPPTQDVRFASAVALSNIGQTVNEIRAWFHVQNISELRRFKEISMEVAEIASGMNNISQALIQYGMEDKISKKGNKHGWGIAKAEAIAKAFGAPSQKTLNTYETIGLMIDNKDKIDAVAETVHGLAMNVRNKMGTQEREIAMKQINSFISLIASDQFTEYDIAETRKRVMEMDRFSYRTFQESIFGHAIRHRGNLQNEQNQQLLRIYRKFKGDPRIDVLIDWLEKKEKIPENE